MTTVVEHAHMELAFRLYAQLLQKGQLSQDQPGFREYIAQSEVRSLVDTFATEMDSVVVKTSDHLYLVPKSGQSPFGMKNAYIKREYLGYQATNIDLYMMYFAIIVLFGEFYDSYETPEATRDFLPIGEWMSKIRERLDTIKEQGEEQLAQNEGETEWNWVGVIHFWDSLDDLKETAKRQDTKQQSRLGFLKRVIRFLDAQDLVQDQGNDELKLTEKAKIIVQRYYMDREYNRDLLAYMYQFDQVKGNDPDAGHR
ncbi:DUF6063 family protein [Heliobacterium mobile]|nr:DUF6063 family protein [Heliobacterium mobile]